MGTTTLENPIKLVDKNFMDNQFIHKWERTFLMFIEYYMSLSRRFMIHSYVLWCRICMNFINLGNRHMGISEMMYTHIL
jgi:hypothetical protein